MNKMVIYIMVLAAALAVKPEGNDIGKLQPVEVVAAYREQGVVIIETDTGDMGRGLTVDEAIANLKETTAGTVFLDTADYLIIGEESEELIEPLRNYLKSSVRACAVSTMPNLADAAAYLRVHVPATRLSDVDGTWEMNKLTVQNDRLNLS